MRVGTVPVRVALASVGTAKEAMATAPTKYRTNVRTVDPPGPLLVESMPPEKRQEQLSRTAAPPP